MTNIQFRTVVGQVSMVGTGEGTGEAGLRLMGDHEMSATGIQMMFA